MPYTINKTDGTTVTKATSAQYADLAEIYESDQPYPVGTVVIFGGDKEITQAMADADPRVAGVISENPAYLMNSNAIGQPVALMGKVSVTVRGVVKKGQMLVSIPGGMAKAENNPAVGTVLGKALEDTVDYAGEGMLSVIQVVVGRC
jgi:K+/H+ antiporter YhaU regulatory subunit KhtT